METVYCLVRSEVHPNQSIVAQWTIFHAKLLKNQQLKMSQVKMPMNLASPGAYTIMCTTIKHGIEATNVLGFKNTPFTFDMGLLKDALEISWTRHDEFSDIVLGYLFADAGLINLLHESGVFAARTVQHMLRGKEYDKSLKDLIMADEALTRHLYSKFKSWCALKETDISQQVTELLQELSPMFTDNNADIYAVMGQLTTAVLKDINHVVLQFREEGKGQSPTLCR